MADPVFVDDVTPLNAVNMNKLQTRDEEGQPNGYASLGSDGKVPTAQLPTIPAPGADLDYLGDYTPGTYVDGDIVVKDGVAYMCVGGPTVVAPNPVPWGPAGMMSGYAPVPSYGTSLPGGPLDGQEAILVDSVTNPSYQWRFRYNAGSSSPYKWEFIGGAPWVILPPPFTPSAVAAYEQDLQAGAFLNIPRNGAWICETSADIGSPTPDSGQYMGFSTTDRVGQWAKSGTEASIFYRNLYSALTVGGVVSNYFYCSTGISQFNRRLISVLPVRVS